MRLELIQLTRYETNDDPVELDDYTSGSYALYQAHNPSNKELVYFMPDERRPAEPRCDYLLTSKNDPAFPSRFIELKGGDMRRLQRCCRTEWDHAFHQLVCTYREFEVFMDIQTEKLLFVLCTSIEKNRVAARFKNYKWYRELREKIVGEVIILYKDEFDTVS